MSAYAISVSSAIIGAAVAIITNYWRTRYTVRSQDFSKRIEEICKLVGELEAAACDHWSDKNNSKPNTSQYVLGFQEKISLLISYLDEQYNNFNTEIISEPLALFFESCTGGNFDDNTTSEPRRIRQIMVEGEKLKIQFMKTRGGLY
jgi:hypothetical protein